ncbi:MAG: prephenate dehydratase domain-containing protein [Erysipelotrichaceae bacterium]|nr:prephenate dehydratase domain-containing protein [Erysipelotrichaceae bacterium]
MKKLVLMILVFLLAGCSAAEETIPVVIDQAAKVSYLGPRGTYTEEACKTFFDEQASLQPYETVADAVEALLNGESRYAVIPQENTIGGAVIDYVDILIVHPSLSVVGEVELPITQNLLSLPGAELSQIRTVYSHPQGLTQGAQWLQENLPEAEKVVVSSTAEGARLVAEGNDPSCAAIASAGSAEVYGLQVLAPGIQNSDFNKTRFYVLSTEQAATESADRLAFLASGPAEELPALMKKMEELKMVLVAIHDRPLKTELGHYVYVIECAGSSYGDYQKLCQQSSLEFRYLGSFSVK